MSACVVVHAIGTAVILRGRLSRWLRESRGWRGSLVALVALMTGFGLLHFLEVAIWALAYEAAGLLPDWETSLYFSGVTYTTVGFGDIVVGPGWRLVACVEALTGILMVGWTTAVLIFVLTTRRERINSYSDS